MRPETVGSNWAGNYAYRARALHRPATLEELQDTVAGASAIRVLGSRHSFSGIADSEELVVLDRLPSEVEVDTDTRTVSLSGGLTYGELAEALNAEALALGNLASLPHISVAGSVATATHGSGDRSGNLATAVAALDILTSSGEIVTASRGGPDFDGLVVGLGALGAVIRITLDVEPEYAVRQRVYEGLTWNALFANFDAITASGDSVSVFTRWGERTDQVWVKSRVTEQDEAPRQDLFGAVAATVNRHPVLGMDPLNCSPQMGEPGLWSERLSHFKMGFTPSSGAELQSEYTVAREHAVSAIEALLRMGDRIAPLIQVSELRTVAADELWLSPQYRQDTIGIHFTWRPEPDAVARVLPEVEAALADYDARPHWGKLFAADATRIASLYERLPDFVRLTERLDPRGAFRNAWLEEKVLGDG